MRPSRFIAFAGAALIACESLAGLQGAGTSHPVDDGAGDDGAGDGGATTIYHAMTSASYWSTFDLATIGITSPFAGAVFDGRFVYFVPSTNGASQSALTARYDTITQSWSTFNLNSVSGAAAGFAGGTFDGRFVYFAPWYNGTYDSLVTRYDTTAAFDAGAAWQTFNASSINPNAAGFHGSVFDGRYVYFVPYDNGAADGVVTRYDTTTSFDAGTSWQTFNTGTVNADAVGFIGGVFDGRFVYFVPSTNGSVTRYDTTALFDAGASWQAFGIGGAVNENAQGFIGGVFDGRYVYFVPYDNGAYDGVVARYDTTALFDAGASWQTFDVSSLNAGAKGFFGGAFDGRYVYFVPYDNGAPDGVVARYDTTAPLGTNTSWDFFDTSTLSANAIGFAGAAFDGQYVYLVPKAGTAVAIFDAKTPASVPPTVYGGSFL